jgi:hypothetical protein
VPLQCSDWGERPLSAAQLLYAGVDAHCLTTLYDVLMGHVTSPAPPLLTALPAAPTPKRVGKNQRRPAGNTATQVCPPITKLWVRPGAIW